MRRSMTPSVPAKGKSSQASAASFATPSISSSCIYRSMTRWYLPPVSRSWFVLSFWVSMIASQRLGIVNRQIVWRKELRKRAPATI
jgi:hypothetical protein